MTVYPIASNTQKDPPQITAWQAIVINNLNIYQKWEKTKQRHLK